VSPERVWELDGAQRHLKGLFLRHLPPTHIYEIWMVLLSCSKAFYDQSKSATLFIFAKRRGCV
jgi:hypothetical protein